MTYTGVELVLRIALVDLGDHVYRATTLVRLRSNARRLSNIASPPTASGEFSIDRFALNAFTNEAPVGVNVGVGANVAGTCISDQLLLLRVLKYPRFNNAYLRDRSNESELMSLLCVTISQLSAKQILSCWDVNMAGVRAMG
jgi:hypothetical protein